MNDDMINDAYIHASTNDYRVNVGSLYVCAPLLVALVIIVVRATDDGGGIGDGVVRSAALPCGPNGGVVTISPVALPGRAEKDNYTHRYILML